MCYTFAMRGLYVTRLGFVLGAAGCAATPIASGGPGLPPPDQSLPVTSGSFAGRYEVPTSEALSPAAVFEVKEVNWIVVDGVVSLEYALPPGLVGGHVRVSLSGTLEGGMATLAGPQGTGACTATATTITCREAMPNVGPLPISMATVKDTARADYAGPVSDRVAVAIVFSSDPIGFVELDLTSPITPDGEGGGGGGGGGHGSGH